MKKIFIILILLTFINSCGVNEKKGNISKSGSIKKDIVNKQTSNNKLKEADIQMKKDMKNISEEILNNEISEEEALDKIVNSMEKSIEK